MRIHLLLQVSMVTNVSTWHSHEKEHKSQHNFEQPPAVEQKHKDLEIQEAIKWDDYSHPSIEHDQTRWSCIEL